MAVGIGAVGSRGLESDGSKTGFRAQGLCKKRSGLTLVAAVASGLTVVIAAVACFAAPHVGSLPARSFSTPWAITTVDDYPNWDVGRSSSLALDSKDNVHISYYDFTRGNLMYATNAELVEGYYWTTWAIDSDGNVGWGTSIAVDSEDKVHISYVGDSGTKYATNAGGSWATTTLNSNPGLDTSIAIDSNDRVHICYRDLAVDTLIYTNNVTGSWAATPVDTDVVACGWGGPSVSLALDSEDKAHISYLVGFHESYLDDQGLAYATNASGAWITYDFGPGGMTPYMSTSLGLDSKDNVHIAFGRIYLNIIPTDSDLFYATNVGGSWEFSTIGSIGAGRWVSLEVDSGDCVHVANMGVLWYGIEYITNIGSAWTKDSFDCFCMNGLSLAIDSNNWAHISFYEDRNCSLMYATNAEPVIPEFGPTGVVVVIMAIVCIFVATRRRAQEEMST